MDNIRSLCKTVAVRVRASPKRTKQKHGILGKESSAMDDRPSPEAADAAPNPSSIPAATPAREEDDDTDPYSPPSRSSSMDYDMGYHYHDTNGKHYVGGGGTGGEAKVGGRLRGMGIGDGKGLVGRVRLPTIPSIGSLGQAGGGGSLVRATGLAGTDLRQELDAAHRGRFLPGLTYLPVLVARWAAHPFRFLFGGGMGAGGAAAADADLWRNPDWQEGQPPPH